MASFHAAQGSASGLQLALQYPLKACKSFLDRAGSRVLQFHNVSFFVQFFLGNVGDHIPMFRVDNGMGFQIRDGTRHRVCGNGVRVFESTMSEAGNEVGAHGFFRARCEKLGRRHDAIEGSVGRHSGKQSRSVRDGEPFIVHGRSSDRPGDTIWTRHDAIANATVGHGDK